MPVNDGLLRRAQQAGEQLRRDRDRLAHLERENVAQRATIAALRESLAFARAPDLYSSKYRRGTYDGPSDDEFGEFDDPYYEETDWLE